MGGAHQEPGYKASLLATNKGPKGAQLARVQWGDIRSLPDSLITV